MRPVPSAREVLLERRLSAWAVSFLTLFGLWFLLAPLLGEWTGYAWLVGRVGEAGVARLGVAFLFLYFAGIVREKNDLRHTLQGLMHIVNRELHGADYRQARATVRTLIGSLASDREDIREKAAKGLRTLTGQDFGTDRERWEAWWAVHEDSFGRPAGRPEPPAPGQGSG